MASRSFGSLQWDCVIPGSRWMFDDGWGAFQLSHYTGRAKVWGWYLELPGEPGEWMGKTLTTAALAAEPVILAKHPRSAQ